MTIYSGFTYYRWWFSIAMLNYQRVPYDGQLAVCPAMASLKQIVVEAVTDGSIFAEAMIHFWFRWFGMLGSPNLKVMKGIY